MHRTQSNRNRRMIALDIALAGFVGAMVGYALPLPESLSDPRYELAVIASDGNAHIADYGLTLSDCVGLWAQYPASVGLECNPVGER